MTWYELSERSVMKVQGSFVFDSDFQLSASGDSDRDLDEKFDILVCFRSGMTYEGKTENENEVLLNSESGATDLFVEFNDF